MKHTLLLCFVLLTFTGLQAQNELSFVEETNVLMGVEANAFEGVGYNHMINHTTTTRTLRWRTTVIEMTEGWQVAVCDRNLCYLPATTTETFVAMPDTLNRMDVHVYPNGNEGSAIIQLDVFDVDNLDVSVSHTYYFNTQPSSTTEIDRQSIKVYPNPVRNGLFSIEGTEQAAGVQVFNLTGQQVKMFTYTPGRWYNVEELPRGTYLVRLIDGQSRDLVTKLMYKL